MRRTVNKSRPVSGEPGVHLSAPWGRPLVSELLESIPDPVIGCDATGRVVYWNRAAHDAYGFSAEEVLGQPVVKLLGTRFPAPLLEIMELVTDVGHWQGRLIHRTREGRMVEVESRWVARYDDGGRLVGGFGIERSMGGAPDAEAQPPTPMPALRPVEADDSASRHAGAMLHDFNNALAIIINYAAFVAAEVDRLRTAPTESERAAMRGDLEQISTAAKRAAQLTARLLAFARHRSAAPVPIDLNQAIREIAGLLRCTLGERVTLALELGEDVGVVRGDTIRVQQTIVDLAAAARDAIPGDGTVTIETGLRESDADAGRRVRVRVTGVGSSFEASFELPGSHAPA